MKLEVEWIECHELPQAARTALTDDQLQRWVQLSCQVQGIVYGVPLGDNEPIHTRLARFAEQDRKSPLTALYPLWLAESLLRQSSYAEAIPWYETALERADNAPLFGAADLRGTALHHGAAARAIAKDLAGAVDWSKQLWAASQNPAALLDAGKMAEEAGEHALAAKLYAEIAAATTSRDAESAEQHARRRAQRIADRDAPTVDTVEKLADSVFKALRARKPKILEKLASRTHFYVGPIGGHLEFDDGEMLDILLKDLAKARIEAREPMIEGSGDRFHLNTQGWHGDTLVGDVSFMFSRWTKGWQWTGVTVTAATDPLKERWTPATKQTNQPLTIPLEAPWLTGFQCQAGGVIDYGWQTAQLAGFGPFAYFAALAWSDRDCGFGPRGLYYNQLPTHTEEDAFAIDITYAREGDPWRNSSNRLTAAVPRIGIVASACGNNRTGADIANFVEILHDDRPASIGPNRFLSRYLHMAGPGRLGVFIGALVVEGTTIGPIDSTGNAAIDHLHFSIHDQTRPFPGVGTPQRIPAAGACTRLVRGSSIRPTPMNGQRLFDDDDGVCLWSRTTPGIVFHQGGPGAAAEVIVVHARA